MQNEVEAFITTYIRPRVQADGGELAFESLDGGDLRLVLMGECAVCPVSGHMAGWIGEVLEDKFGRKFNVITRNKRRYFQDV